MFTIDPKDNAKIKYKTEYHKDAGGNITGWSLTETRPDGEYGVFEFNSEGVLTGYEKYTLETIHLNTVYLEERIRFNDDGEMICRERWDYLPEDGLGWDFYRTEYDVKGNVIDSDWHGQA